MENINTVPLGSKGQFITLPDKQKKNMLKLLRDIIVSSFLESENKESVFVAVEKYVSYLDRETVPGCKTEEEFFEWTVNRLDRFGYKDAAFQLFQEDGVKRVEGIAKDRASVVFKEPEDPAKYRTVAAETHKAPNDKITISLFNPKKRQWEQGKFLINENPNGSERVITPVDMREMGLTPFNSFDRIVFNTCHSLMAAGNLATTTDIIFAHMTGSNKRGKPTEEMRRKIKDSIIKVSSPWIRIDVESANDAFHYESKKKIYEGRLLYAKFEQVIINGNTVEDGITFWGKSPLVEIAEIRNQILSFPKELLDVPVSATEETIVMRGELLRVVMGIVKHGLTPTILFSTVFASIGYNEMDKQQQQRTRKKAALMMDTWKEAGLFKSYTIEKEGQTPVKFVVACNGKPRKVKG